MKFRRTIAPVIGVTVLLFALAVPANATTTGEVTFQCTAILDPFPSSGSTGTCDGTASGEASGIADDGTAYAVAWAGLENFSADFTYDETCDPATNEPLEGSASGTAWIDAGAGVYDGQATANAKLEVTFEWERDGLTAVIDITSAVITFNDISGQPTATSELAPVLPAEATAAFAPTSVPDCDNPQRIEAEVVGEGALAL